MPNGEEPRLPAFVPSPTVPQAVSPALETATTAPTLGALAPGATRKPPPWPLFLIPGFAQGYFQASQFARLRQIDDRQALLAQLQGLQELKNLPPGSVRKQFIRTVLGGLGFPEEDQKLLASENDEALLAYEGYVTQVLKAYPELGASQIKTLLRTGAVKLQDILTHGALLDRQADLRALAEASQGLAPAPPPVDPRQAFFAGPGAAQVGDVETGPVTEPSLLPPPPSALETLRRRKAQIEQVLPTIRTEQGLKNAQTALDRIDAQIDRLTGVTGGITQTVRGPEGEPIIGRFTGAGEPIAALGEPPLTYETDIGKLQRDRRMLLREGAATSSPAIQALDRKLARAGQETAESAIGKTADDLDRARRLYGTESLQYQSILQALKIGGEPAKLSDKASMRQQFVNLSKDFIIARDSYGRLLEAARDPSAAGDIALLYNFNKLLDPGSIVRQSEFELASSAGSIHERLRGTWQRVVIDGQRLTELQRADFVRQSHGQFASQRRFQQGLEQQYGGLAKKAGIDPEEIVVNFLLELRTQEQPPKPGQPRPKPSESQEFTIRGQSIKVRPR